MINRESLPLDVLEAVRAEVTRLLDNETLKRDDSSLDAMTAYHKVSVILDRMMLSYVDDLSQRIRCNEGIATKLPTNEETRQ